MDHSSNHTCTQGIMVVAFITRAIYHYHVPLCAQLMEGIEYNRAFLGDLLGFRPQRKTEFSYWST